MAFAFGSYSNQPQSNRNAFSFENNPSFPAFGQTNTVANNSQDGTFSFGNYSVPNQFNNFHGNTPTNNDLFGNKTTPFSNTNNSQSGSFQFGNNNMASNQFNNSSNPQTVPFANSYHNNNNNSRNGTFTFGANAFTNQFPPRVETQPDLERIRTEQKRLADRAQQLRQQQDLIDQELQNLKIQETNTFQFNQNNSGFSFGSSQSNPQFNFQAFSKSTSNNNLFGGQKDKISKKMPRNEKDGNTVTIECPICLDYPSDISTTLCGHIFCEGCINHHVNMRGNCPICNQTLSLSSIHRIYLF